MKGKPTLGLPLSLFDGLSAVLCGSEKRHLTILPFFVLGFLFVIRSYLKFSKRIFWHRRKNPGIWMSYFKFYIRSLYFSNLLWNKMAQKRVSCFD